MIESTRHRLPNSQRLQARAEKVIPGGSQTLSKAPSQWVQSAPKFIERGEDAWVWDVDGNRYLDLPMALAPVILGYRYSAVDEAIREQLDNGIAFSLPHRLEVEVAERLVEMIPGAEQVRFAKNGSDATAAAVRLARIFTGREHVICTGYHGQQDWFMASSQFRKGIPYDQQRLIRPIALSDLDLLESEMRHRVACIILEPANACVPTAEHLQEIIDIAHRYGALVIFDEVITGFRLAPGGAQEHFGVQADLACFGKALGNGMPISAITGRTEIMEHIGFLSYTHAGETLSLAAAKATLDTLTMTKVLSRVVYENIWRLGHQLQDGIYGAIQRHGLGEHVTCRGLPPRTVVEICEPHPIRDGLLPAKSLLQQELARRGVLFNGNNLICYAMTHGDADFAIRAYDEALGVLAEALPDNVEFWLDGPPIRQVFWRR